KITEATSRMASMASGISDKASGQWDKLENIFEDRVSRALKKLGVPSHKDIDALVTRIDELNRNVSKLSASKGASKGTPKKPSTKLRRCARSRNRSRESRSRSSITMRACPAAASLQLRSRTG